MGFTGQGTIKLVVDTGLPNGGIAASDTRFADDSEARGVMAGCLAAAAQGCMDGYFDLGVAFSTGSHGFDCDLVEAHKWFNLAAVGGHPEAARVRAEVADDMTAREIAEAQRRAREWLRNQTTTNIRAA